jgi:hypothetical protein
MGLAASVCQPSILRMLIWPEASSAQNSMAAVSAKDWQIERAAVEGRHLRRHLSNLVDEGLDEFLLGPLTDVWRADGLNLVSITRPVGDQCADADNRVVDKPTADEQR